MAGRRGRRPLQVCELLQRLAVASAVIHLANLLSKVLEPAFNSRVRGDSPCKLAASYTAPHKITSKSATHAFSPQNCVLRGPHFVDFDTLEFRGFGQRATRGARILRERTELTKVNRK